jgi:hypothetical protein
MKVKYVYFAYKFVSMRIYNWSLKAHYNMYLVFMLPLMSIIIYLNHIKVEFVQVYN